MCKVVQISSFLLLLLLAACSVSNPSPTPLKIPTQVSDPTSNPISLSTADAGEQLNPQTTTVTPEETVSIPLPNTQYTLTAVLNYGGHSLAVDEKIRYVNRTGVALSDLVLMVEPSYYPDVFKLNGIVWEDGQAVEGVSKEIGQIRFPLLQPLPPAESVTLSVSYELRLPSPVPSSDTRPVPFGYTARQTNLVDWYPFVPAYSPRQGWLAHKAGYFGEHLVYEIADFQVNIQISDDRQNLIIAASAPAQVDGDWRHYQLYSARSFAWSVSHDYQITSATVGEVEILSYAFPFHSQAGERVLQTTAEALALYNELYGPYPRKQLSVVEADFLDGMEYDGLYFLSNGFYNLYQGKPDEFLVAIAAHETAHQWFYGLVGNDQAYEPWLDEALCTYNEKLYYEQFYPDALDWWWDYRINYYDPRGWVDGSIYNPEGYRAYRDAIYLNGAVFIEDLRAMIGNDAFFAFLADYVDKNRDQIATARDFFAILEQHTEVDISPLLSRYFEQR